MWAEVIFSRDDLALLLAQALPLTIHLGDDAAEHSLALTDLGAVSLVEGVGLRIVCKARVHWPVLGIELPVALNALTLLLLPTIGAGPHGDILVFRLSIEQADFAGLPAMIDAKVTDAINAKLAGKDVELSWDFSKTLTQLAPLPALLDPLDALALRPAWGKVRITDEAVVYAVSFHAAIVRRGEAVPADVAPIVEATGGDTPGGDAVGGDAPGGDGAVVARSDVVRPAVERSAAPQVVPTWGGARHVASAGVFGAAAGAAYFVLRAIDRARR